MTSIRNIFISLTSILLLTNCGTYSLDGTTIPEGTETFQVNFFQNNSSDVVPNIDFTFTDRLRELILNQTNLSLVTTNGDIIYEGEITNFRISPTNATSQLNAAQNRLNVTVNVRYFSKYKPEDDFEQPFSFFFDYGANEQLTGSILNNALEEIFERITQDIYNASFNKW